MVSNEGTRCTATVGASNVPAIGEIILDIDGLEHETVDIEDLSGRMTRQHGHRMLKRLRSAHSVA